MGFIACPQCGNSNRDSDPLCFSCGADLTTAEPPPPPPPSHEVGPLSGGAGSEWEENLDVRVKPLSPSSGNNPNAGRFKDLASRYESKPVPKLDANILHGLRSALPAGLIVGAGYGLLHKLQKTELTTLVLRKHKKMPPMGGEMFGYALGFDLFLALVIGLALGISNLLCYVPESGRVGAVLGFIASGVMIYFSHTSYAGLLIGAVNGFLLGTLASLIERKLFRRIA